MGYSNQEMSIVYVLGAGASHGDTLKSINESQTPPNTAKIPLATGFFDPAFLRQIGYELAVLRKDYPLAFEYIMRVLVLPEPNREDFLDPWKTVDLERVFTALEFDREFWGFESDYGARCILARNNVQRLLFRLLALPTHITYGENARRLVSSLDPDDSVITFNWDLIIDQEFLSAGGDNARQHYRNFIIAALEGNGGMAVDYGPASIRGVYLKMHGSMNWFQCINHRCPAHQGLVLWEQTQHCLLRLMGAHWANETCTRCGSTTEPLIIPPLLRKPIAENWIVRSIWGLAHKKLLAAHVAVIIGFSFPPTDFAAQWLLHSTLGLQSGVSVFVVNPANSEQSFREKMISLFPGNVNLDFTSISQLPEIIKAAKRAEPERIEERRRFGLS